MDVLSLEFADLPAREMSGEPVALRCVLDVLRPEWRHREKRRPRVEPQNIPNVEVYQVRTNQQNGLRRSDWHGEKRTR